MTYDIDDDTLAKAHKCGKGHACLDGDEDCLSPVIRRFAGKDSKHAYVQCGRYKSCSYKIAFGTDINPVCSCPVRMEIHRRYGK